MANELVKGSKKKSVGKGSAGAVKKRVKKVVAAGDVGGLELEERRQDGLRTAFHHMQRASVVISLMEKGTGEDLRDLLARGVKLYEKACGKDAEEKILLRAIGLLRAAEHLALAGLYAARHKHRQKVTAPDEAWLAEFIAETNGRLERIEGVARGKGPDLFPATVEMLRQAEESEGDPHMAYELAMSADALCFALENGL